MDTRILIAIILSLATVFAYQELVLKRLYPPPSQQSAQPKASLKAIPGTPAPGAKTPEQAPAASGVEPLPAAGAETGAGRTIEVDTELYDAVFTTRGARLKSLRLKRFRETASPTSAPLEMVGSVPGGALPLGLILDRGGSSADDRDLVYRSEAPDRIVVKPGEHPLLSFTAETPEGLTLTKSFSFTASDYAFQMRAEIASTSATLATGGFELSEPLIAHRGYYDISRIQAYVSDKVVAAGEKELRKGVAPVSGTITYAGFGDRYFISVLLPQSPSEGTLAMDYDGVEANARLLFPAGHASVLRLASEVYIGPKALTLLEAVNPSLSKAIDFGWTRILALAFLRALKLFHSIAPNYGVDIVLLTVAIRIVFLPISIKSQRSMMRLQRLQPQVDRLRDKFKDDRDRLNREMVDLYKRNHVNPLGGCAPMALQLPIFIGLYEALLNAVELRHAPFVGWIRDLSAPDCLMIPRMPVIPFTECGGLPVLVILMGLSTFLQQWMSPQAADPNQQRMMMVMPIVFTLMLINFPAGLSLYYFSSNVLGVIQQWFLNREFKQPSPVSA